MRVVAGSAGGIQLTVPKAITRPTMDKVRGAVFSSLGDAVPGSRVLDLFAGSGGFGIEALSRGAVSATFVDNHRDAADVIRMNLKRTQLTGRLCVSDTLAFLRNQSPGAYDLIFADPPYSKKPDDVDHASQLIVNEHLHAALATNGTFVLETASFYKLPDLAAAGWTLLRSRTYGDTSVHFFIHAS